MANNTQPIILLPPPFLCTIRAYEYLYTNLTNSATAPSNQHPTSPWSGLRNRALLENSTVDFVRPSAKHGAIGSRRPKPAPRAQKFDFAKEASKYTAAAGYIWGPFTSTDGSRASSSPSSSKKVTFEPGLQSPSRSSPEQKARFRARAKAMVDEEASTAIKMMLAFALYEYCATRAWRLWMAEGVESVDDGEINEE